MTNGSRNRTGEFQRTNEKVQRVRESLPRLWSEIEEKGKLCFTEKSRPALQHYFMEDGKQLRGVLGKSKDIISLQNNYSSPFLSMSLGESALLEESGAGLVS